MLIRFKIRKQIYNKIDIEMMYGVVCVESGVIKEYY